MADVGGKGGVFKVTGFWGFVGLVLIVILIWDFLQKPTGGIGLARTFSNFFTKTFGLLTAHGSGG